MDKQIRIGLIGLGSMGRGLLYQASITPGVICTMIADMSADTVVASVDGLGISCETVSESRTAESIVGSGAVAIIDDPYELVKSNLVDLVIEASSSTLEGGQYSFKAIENGKHLVLMNAEVDLMFGIELTRDATRQGVVFTSIDGDQYGVLKRMIDEIQGWGFGLVMAGNIKGFLDRYSNPSKIIPEADKRNLDYKMAASYTDGSKLNIEMALIANALDLRTPKVGMIGEVASKVQEVPSLIDVEKIYESTGPFVDYVLGAEPGGGVYIIGHCKNHYQQSMLSYYKMGDGPFYLFYRHYHLCHIEAMRTVLEAVEHNRPLLQPWAGEPTNVYTYAKRDLTAGEKLDGAGGYLSYGLIENNPIEGRHKGLPLLMSDDLVLSKGVKADQPILLEDVVTPLRRLDFDCYLNR